MTTRHLHPDWVQAPALLHSSFGLGDPVHEVAQPIELIEVPGVLLIQALHLILDLPQKVGGFGQIHRLLSRRGQVLGPHEVLAVLTRGHLRGTGLGSFLSLLAAHGLVLRFCSQLSGVVRIVAGNLHREPPCCVFSCL